MGGSGIRYSVFMCVLESKGVYLCESKTLRYLKYKCIIYKNNSSVFTHIECIHIYTFLFKDIIYARKSKYTNQKSITMLTQSKC